MNRLLHLLTYIPLIRRLIPKHRRYGGWIFWNARRGRLEFWLDGELVRVDEPQRSTDFPDGETLTPLFGVKSVDVELLGYQLDWFRIDAAPDGEVITMDDPNAVKEFNIGAPDAR